MKPKMKFDVGIGYEGVLGLGLRFGFWKINWKLRKFRRKSREKKGI